MVRVLLGDVIVLMVELILLQQLVQKLMLHVLYQLLSLHGQLVLQVTRQELVQNKLDEIRLLVQVLELLQVSTTNLVEQLQRLLHGELVLEVIKQELVRRQWVDDLLLVQDSEQLYE